MEEVHREIIQKRYAVLVESCNIDVLLPLLLEKQVFSSAMITKYMNISDGALKRKRDLFLDIQRRGPTTFDHLVSSLRETGQHRLADLLVQEPRSTNGAQLQKRHTVPFILPSREDTIQIQDLANSNPNIYRININSEPLKIKVKSSTRFYDDQMQSVVPVYSTHSKNRGAVLIINNINYINDLHPPRKGAEVDGRNLQNLFLQIGLEVEMHIDLLGLHMEEVIRNFKNSTNLKNVDIVFVIIMGHGNQETEVTNIFGTDNKIVSTKWIEEQFDNAHCKPLQKRPKIIMYQTCRGNMPDYGVARSTEYDSAFHGVLRTCDDMLVAHSTLPGTASHRDVYLGTWFINLFCKVMMEHSHNTHLEDVFKMVDSRLAELRSADKTMQTSMFTNLGFKNCFVHPNIYLENGVICKFHDN